MPLIDVTFPAGSLTDEQKDDLCTGLMTALLRAERAPDTEFFRSVTWTHLHELPADAVRTAGRPVASATFLVVVTTPEGALSDRRRAELVAAATEVVRDVTGISEEEAALRVWVLCREIADGGWGAGGHVIPYKALVEAAAAEREKTAAQAAT